MKKGRHRRFEEARKLKQSGPEAFGIPRAEPPAGAGVDDDDEYAELAQKYGVEFDEDEDDDDA